MTSRHIHGLLTLSSRLQIHENLKEDFMQSRKVPDRLWIIEITYLTGRTNKSEDITKNLTFHIFEYLAESDKIFVDFVLTH